MAKPLTEEQVNSGDFDQPPCPVKIKLIICSTPRSGSYLLCRAMIHHGIGVPHEYFNGINASTIGPRLGVGNVATPELEIDGPARQAYIAALLKHRTVNGVFAFKIQGGQLAQYFQRSGGNALFQGAHYIYLYREDLLAQAVSFHVSLLTGRWGVGNTVTTQAVQNAQFFDNGLIENRLQIIADQDKEWRLFFARNGIFPLFISYETIKADLPATLREIVAHTKIELPSLDFQYAEPAPPDFRGPGEPSKLEIKDNFLQSKKV
jgi:LPS sulfotransferase NodH